jgi:hypothetical protein
MSQLPRVAKYGTALALYVACGGVACAASTVTARSAPIDGLTRTAQARYNREASGVTAQHKLNRAASDPALLSALRRNDMAALRRAAQYQQIGTHQHISCLRIMRGSQVLARFGGSFCVRPARKTLTDSHGRALATMEVSIQDVIGYVRYMHRHYPVQIVVRGQGRGQLLTSLPAAARTRLPDSGSVTIGGHHYAVRSFGDVAMGPDPIKVWVLA